MGSVIYPESTLTLGEVLLAAVFALVLVATLRLLYEQGIERIYRRGLGRTTAIVMGNTDELDRIRRMLDSTSGGYTCVGQLNIQNDDTWTSRHSGKRSTKPEPGASYWPARTGCRTRNCSTCSGRCVCVGCECGSYPAP